MPVKQKVFCAVLAAIGLCFAAEAVCRLFPSLLPYDLNVFRMKHAMAGRYMETDDDLGPSLKADFHQVFKWRGRKLEIRNAPIPGQSRVGYRVDSRTLGRPQADIVALGDSFTYAVEVDQESTWPSRLGAITGLQVANLGVPGYGTAQEVELFRRYGSKLHPKLVVLLLGPADPSKNVFFRSWRALKGSGDSGARYSHTMFCRSIGMSGTACRAMKFAATNSGILPDLALNWLLLRWRAMPLVSPENADAGRPITYQVLEDMRSLVSSQGVKFCVITTDYWESLFPKSYAELAGFLRSKGIPYLNLRLQAKYPRVKLQIVMDGHWNEKGHALAAAEIHRFLLRNNLLPARVAASHSFK